MLTIETGPGRCCSGSSDPSRHPGSARPRTCRTAVSATAWYRSANPGTPFSGLQPRCVFLRRWSPSRRTRCRCRRRAGKGCTLNLRHQVLEGPGLMAQRVPVLLGDLDGDLQHPVQERKRRRWDQRSLGSSGVGAGVGVKSASVRADFGAALARAVGSGSRPCRERPVWRAGVG